MRQIFLPVFFILLLGCEEQKIRKHNQELKEKFNGKYELISSVSNVPVDINIDGIVSTNLLEENPQLVDAFLEIRIIDRRKNALDGMDKHLFEEWWPVEYFGIGSDTTNYYTVSYINYLRYPTLFYFEFDLENEKIYLEHASLIAPEPPNTFLSLEGATVEGDEYIKVVNTRKLFTIDGWKVVRIESLYQRFTMIT